jgi:hypothetical protein
MILLLILGNLDASKLKSIYISKKVSYNYLAA